MDKLFEVQDVYKLVGVIYSQAINNNEVSDLQDQVNMIRNDISLLQNERARNYQDNISNLKF